MRIELTKQMREALKANQTLELVDPLTQQVYVLIEREEYEKARMLLDIERSDPSFYEFTEIVLDEPK